MLAIPVGNAGNISAYWAGFCDYRTAGRTTSVPRMYGFQAAGAAPIVLGHRVDLPETIATAIRIGDPASWTKATSARDDSDGLIEAVTDDQILAAWRELLDGSRGSSASHRRRRAWPGSAAWPARAGSIGRPRSCAS